MRLVLALATLVLAPLAAAPAAPPRAGAPADPLAFLEPLLGEWQAPPEVQRERPDLRGRVVHSYAPVVGGNALRVLEGYATGSPAEADLEGLVLWDPAGERVELVAVAGRARTGGRVFRGEYRALEGGAIERVYDVTYRTTEDTPGGEDLGGRVRRYREVYTRDGDTLTATLDWWRDGAWRPFGPGRYTMVLAE